MVMDEAAFGEEEEGDERNGGERKVGSHGWLMGFKCEREREREKERGGVLNGIFS